MSGDSSHGQTIDKEAIEKGRREWRTPRAIHPVHTFGPTSRCSVIRLNAVLFDHNFSKVGVRLCMLESNALSTSLVRIAAAFQD